MNSRLAIVALAVLAGLSGAVCAQGSAYGVDAQHKLWLVDLGDASATLVGEIRASGVGVTAQALGMDASGTLYTTASNGGLYTVDLSTAAATLVGFTGLGPVISMDWDSANSRMLVGNASATPSIYSIDLGNAAATLITTASAASTAFQTIATHSGGSVLDVRRSSGLAGAFGDKAATFDTSSGTVLTLDGLFSDISGMDYGSDGSLYGLTKQGRLVSIASDGLETDIGLVNGGVAFTGMTSVVPEPAQALLLAAGLAGLALRLRSARRHHVHADLRIRLHTWLRAALSALALAVLPLPGAALTVELSSTQVGGFYADGGHDNLAGFQNYFVGYGTTPGSPRTAERRSFFVFDLSGITEPISAASFTLLMPIGGVIGDAPSEIFVLSASSMPAVAVLDPVVTPGAALAIFSTLGTGALVAPELGIDVGAPPGGMLLTMSFNATGLAALNSRPPTGLVVLGGRMASWSFDPDPLHEPHELLFGHSDVVFFGTPMIDAPILTVTVVPEPTGFVLMAGGLGWLLLLMRRRFGSAEWRPRIDQLLLPSITRAAAHA